MRSRVIAAAAFASACLLAQQPSISNARLQTVPISGGLEKSLRTITATNSGPLWLGYAVPAHPEENRGCCWSDSGRVCGLEGRASSGQPAQAGPVQLEGSSHVAVLFRSEGGEIRKVRAFGVDCPLDAGGLPVYWLTGVPAADSIGWLERLAPMMGSKGSLPALAMHRDTAADQSLLRLAREGTTAKLRGDALFWIAQRASRDASRAISEAISRDPDTEVKKKAVFALSQLPKDQGVPLLINVAGTHANPAVRKQAMFWLGQSRDPRALQFFEQILSK